MQSVSAKPLGSYPWLVRLLFRVQRRFFGRVLNSSLSWARSPWVLAAFALFYGALERRSSPLPPVLRSLVGLGVPSVSPWWPFKWGKDDEIGATNLVTPAKIWTR
jgi:hypothetical protein